jgi:hypothetical protein
MSAAQRRRRGSRYHHDDTIDAILSKFASQPNSARVVLIEELVNGLKTDSLWEKIDFLYVMAAHEDTAARVNWKSPGDFTLANIGSPTFTADEGYTGDASTIALNTGFDLGVHATQYTQNSAHGGAWVRAGASANTTVLGARDLTVSTRQLRIDPRRADGSFLLRVNQEINTAKNSGWSNSTGHYIVNRSGSSALQFYYDGSNTSLNVNVTASSTGVPTGQNVFLLAINDDPSSPSASQISIAHIGSSLDSTQAADLYTRFSTYMAGL